MTGVPMKRPLTLVTIWLSLCASAFAADFVATEHAQTRLVSERTGFAPGETVWVALSQKLQEGWHVYWKNPGDSGLPLELKWTLPAGYSAGDVVYPTPEPISVGPLVNFGFHGEPIFLVPITAPADAQSGAAVEVKLTARWLICAEICVPEEGDFSFMLPVSDAPETNADEAGLFAKARAATPVAFTGEAAFNADKDKLVLRAAPMEKARDAYFFPTTEGLTEPAAKQRLALKDSAVTVTMTPGPVYEPNGLATLEGVLLLTGKDGKKQGYEIKAAKSETSLAASAAGGAPGAARSSGGLPILLVTAFLGGIILNVMPCVFPIIFIKAASLLSDAQRDARIARSHGLFYGAGVIATFAALGLLLLALRAGGEQLGWGFHLQSPVVVMLSAYVLLMMGLNLSGVFHVGSSVQGVGGGLADRGGPVGSFFTGALAVFVTAPCIGPLLTAPMGAALLLPPAEGMLIFVAMALGLAAPYVALSFIPALGRLLPRPGPWMITLKQVLAFPVFGAAAYFLWVLAQQTGPEGLAKALAGGLLLAFAAWLFEQSKTSGKSALIRIGAAVAAIAAIAPIVTLKLVDSAQAAEGKHGAIESAPYGGAELAALRAEGRPVFIDFTAAWCVTCQFNKLTVFSSAGLAKAFSENNVAFLVADWTTRDPEVTKALAEFGASGVPLYVYYPPAGEPRVLPLPLSERDILNALKG